MDAYDRQARLAPGAIVTLPITVFVVVIISSVPTWWSALSALLVGSGVLYLGADLVGDHGLRRQPALWAGWDGPPTTRLLRYRDAATNPAAVTRRHDLLLQIAPTLELPSAGAEAADSARADELYVIATNALISRTSDQELFHRVARENRGYGFRRNVWACKPLAVLLAVVSLIVVAALALTAVKGDTRVPYLSLVVTGVADLGVLAVMAFEVGPDWVHRQADRYAAQLFNALEQIAHGTGAS